MRAVHVCPSCGNTVERIHRTPTQRVLSRFYRVGRYWCRECEWTGLIHRPKHIRRGVRTPLLVWVAALAGSLLLLGGFVYLF